MASGPLLSALAPLLALWPFRAMAAEDGPVLQGRQVYLRWPRPDDHPAWARLREASRDWLTPWEPRWPPDALSAEGFGRRLRSHRQDVRNGTGYMFLIFRLGDDALLGGISLSQVRRGAGASGEIGYWLGRAHAGQGYMTDAVETLAAHAFGPLGLRRLEAACLPTNARSKALLARLGFQREGLARAYLCINGRWRDHELHALLAEDWLARGGRIDGGGREGASRGAGRRPGRRGRQRPPGLAAG